MSTGNARGETTPIERSGSKKNTTVTFNMPYFKINITTLLGMTVQRERDYLISYMLPDGLDKLMDENKEVIKSTCTRYAKLPNSIYPAAPIRISFQVLRTVLKRIFHLIQWVKERDRLNNTIEFDGVVTREYLLPDLQEASFHFKYRKAQKKV